MVARSFVLDPLATEAAPLAGDQGRSSSQNDVSDGDASWKVITDKVLARIHLWIRSCCYLQRLAKQKRFWHCAGTALRFIKERQREINAEIDREARQRSAQAFEAPPRFTGAEANYQEWTGEFRAFVRQQNGNQSGAIGHQSGAFGTNPGPSSRGRQARRC